MFAESCAMHECLLTVSGIDAEFLIKYAVGLLLLLDIHAHLGFIFWHLIKLSTYSVRFLFSQMFAKLKKAGRLLFISHKYGHPEVLATMAPFFCTTGSLK